MVDGNRESVVAEKTEDDHMGHRAILARDLVLLG